MWFQQKKKEKTKIAEEISDALMNEADAKSDSWSCVRCTTIAKSVGADGKPVMHCPKCNACKKHGDLDCLVVGCKKS